MDFNFDSQENVITTKTPSVKAINNGGAGLWISNENAEICKWKKDSLNQYINTRPYNIKTNEGDIPGYTIRNPRMLILQRSLLLKVVTKTGKILRAWIAKESKEGNMYACVKKYMVLFVDKNNNPIHEIPLQLTAKGCFQLEFDKQYCEFRKAITLAYNGNSSKSMSNTWYSMCVFVPTFESMARGIGKACITTGFEKPTKENWLSFSVGRRNDLANKFWSNIQDNDPTTYKQYVYTLYCETQKSCQAKGWWRKVANDEVDSGDITDCLRTDFVYSFIIKF
jgi:hypothetical protein